MDVLPPAVFTQHLPTSSVYVLGKKSASGGMQRKRGPLSTNGPKNNDKKMKWLIEAIGILVLQDVLLEEEWEAYKMRFSSIRL
jgi:hypothetical protein